MNCGVFFPRWQHTSCAIFIFLPTSRSFGWDALNGRTQVSPWAIPLLGPLCSGSQRPGENEVNQLRVWVCIMYNQYCDIFHSTFWKTIHTIVQCQPCSRLRHIYCLFTSVYFLHLFEYCKNLYWLLMNTNSNLFIQIAWCNGKCHGCY